MYSMKRNTMFTSMYKRKIQHVNFTRQDDVREHLFKRTFINIILLYLLLCNVKFPV